MEKIHNPIVLKNLMLIAKEAINNISKYSKADQCAISIQGDQKGIILEISDNGKGLDTMLTSEGNGLNNMKQRCEQLKGQFSLQSASDEGLKIQCSFPGSLVG
jgi:signal transduction histidine kinase